MRIRLEYEDGMIRATDLELNGPLYLNGLSPAFRKYYDELVKVYGRNMKKRDTPSMKPVGKLEIELKLKPRKKK